MADTLEERLHRVAAQPRVDGGGSSLEDRLHRVAASKKQTAAPKQAGWGETILGATEDALKGVGAGIFSTVVHGGDVIRRATGQERIIDRPEVQQLITPPGSLAGRAGFGGEQTAEYFLPIAPEIKGTGLARGALRAGTEAVKSGLIGGAQTGTATDAGMSAALGGAGAALAEAPQLVLKRLAQTSKRLTPEAARAIRAAEQAGVPVSMGQRTGKVALQKTERALENLPGSESRASAFFGGQEEALAARNKALVARAAPTSLNEYGTGLALQNRLKQHINRLNSLANRGYDKVRAAAAANLQTVQTGTKPLLGAGGKPMVDAAGNIIRIPVTAVFETPVDLAPIRKGLEPIYEDLKRAMPDARRANSPAWKSLEELMTSDKTHMDALDFDKTLSAVKTLAREGENPFLSTQSQRIAKQIIRHGEAEFQKALGTAGPGVQARLALARKLVRGYHETAELLADLPEEPATLYKHLVAGGDQVFNALRDLHQVAPQEVTTIGRTYLEGMLSKATDEGGFRRAEGVMADWRKLGGETKRLLFGNVLTQDLNEFFLAAKKLAPHEGSATAGRLTALVGLGVAGGVLHALWTGNLEDAAKEAAAGAATAYLLPNIAARVLFAPGGAKLLTRSLTLPAGPALAATARALTMRVKRAEGEESADRQEKPAVAAPPARAPAAAPAPAAPPERRPSPLGQVPQASAKPTGLAPETRQALSEVGRRHGVLPGLITTVARLESAGNPNVPTSPKGAVGLMQVLPATGKQYGLDVFDPQENMEAGARYLRVLMEKYKGDMRLVLAAYNAGPGAVDKYGGVPPYRETREYVRRGLQMLQAAR